MDSSFSGPTVRFEGYVLSASSARDGRFCDVHCGDAVLAFACDLALNPGDIVSGEGTIEQEKSRRVRISRIERLAASAETAALSRIESRFNSALRLPPWSPLSPDPGCRKLEPALRSALQKLLAARAFKRFMLFKYHHDADGISAALAMLSFLAGKAQQQNSAVYNAREALRDLALLQYEIRPLVVLLDLGSGEESAEGLALLKAAGVETVIIDHHPVAPSIPPLVSLLLNPWALGLDSASRFPAGYLAAELGRLSGQPGLEALSRISCAGDKSGILPLSPADHDRALALDYLAMNGGGGNLPFYQKTLDNPELLQSILLQAREKIAELGLRARQRWSERKFGLLRVHTVDLGQLLSGQEFHSKGKIATYLLDQQSPSEAVFILGYDERTIVLRATDAAVAAGFPLHLLIEELKSSHAGFLESGGGHAKAAAIRCRPGFARDVLAALLKLLEEKASSS